MSTCSHNDTKSIPGRCIPEGWIAYLQCNLCGMHGSHEHGWAMAPRTMDFGDAIRALKAGQRVAREGWNGKGMWLALSCNGGRLTPASAFWSKHNAAHAAAQEHLNGHAMVLPCITMKTATGEILMGWLASQTDMLAEDWVEV